MWSYVLSSIALYALMFFFFFLELPEVESITPLFGPLAGGTNLTITGDNFDLFGTIVILGERLQCPLISR